MFGHLTERQAALSWRPSNWILHGLAVSASAAFLAYLLHHLGPFAGHAIFSVGAAVGLTTALTVWVAGRSTLRPEPASPVLVLSSEAELRIKDVETGDLGFCAALHAEALPHGFFVDLGARFLRAYHRTFAESPHALAMVATLQGHPIGFVTGTVNAPAHRRWLFRRRGFSLALLGAGALLVRPRVGLRFLRTRIQQYAGAWRSNRSDADPVDRPQIASAHLSHVATVSGARGVGAGGALVESFLAAAGRSGVDSVTLTTLQGSAGAGAFYERQGWTRGAEGLMFDGRRYEQWRCSCTVPR